MRQDRQALYVLACIALGESQVGLGKRLGISRRTAQRWASRGVPAYDLPKLAQIVYPRDAELAREIARHAGRTLASLGLETPAPAAPPAAPAPPPPPPMPDCVVDAIVCAAAEALDVMPRQVRPGVLAAFARACELGVDSERVTRVLRAQIDPPPSPKGPASKRQSS